MTVEEKVRKIVEQMGVTYLFENWQAANVRLDKMQLPAVMSCSIKRQMFNSDDVCAPGFRKPERGFDAAEGLPELHDSLYGQNEA